MTRGEKWWFSFIRGPLVFLGSILGPLYNLSFGWLDRHLSRKDEERFGNDVRSALPFLFVDGKGRIIKNQGVPFPTPFDYAFVTVEFDNILFRFSRGRGELGANVAPSFAPTDWHSLSLVLSALTEKQELQRKRFVDLESVSKALKPALKRLTESFSFDQFNELKCRLEDNVYSHERKVTREVEFEINSSLYRNKP